jgi:histidinol-phosphate/aromatic aminotransferase/cobyric acid decarboxylase-like protein
VAEVHAEHGGAFFNAIGVDFDHLEYRDRVVNADVLDAWYDPSPKVIDAIRKHLPWLMKTSPPTHGEGLLHAIRDARGLGEDCILIGSGSSSLIFQALPRLVSTNAGVLVLDPSYGEYRHLFDNVLQARVTHHLLEKGRNFVPDLNLLVEQAKDQDLVVLVNPNSPTGVCVDAAFIEHLLSAMHANAVLWVDETYVDFVPGQISVEGLIGQDRRLVVCKSLSKFFALSGLRVGYLAAHADVVDKLRMVSPPWPVGLLSQVAAVEALHDMAYYREKSEETARLRQNLASELAEVAGVRVYPSETNFLLLELNNASATDVVAAGAAQGIFLRNCDSMSRQFDGRFIRTAVKDAAQNRRIGAFLSASLGQPTMADR